MNDPDHQAHFRHICTFVPCPYVHTFPSHRKAFIHEGDVEWVGAKPSPSPRTEKLTAMTEATTPHAALHDLPQPFLNSIPVFNGATTPVQLHHHHQHHHLESNQLSPIRTSHSEHFEQNFEQNSIKKSEKVSILSAPHATPLANPSAGTPVANPSFSNPSPGKTYRRETHLYSMLPKAEKLRNDRDNQTRNETSSVNVAGRAGAWERADDRLQPGDKLFQSTEDAYENVKILVDSSGTPYRADEKQEVGGGGGGGGEDNKSALLAELLHNPPQLNHITPPKEGLRLPEPSPSAASTAGQSPRREDKPVLVASSHTIAMHRSPGREGGENSFDGVSAYDLSGITEESRKQQEKIDGQEEELKRQAGLLEMQKEEQARLRKELTEIAVTTKLTASPIPNQEENTKASHSQINVVNVTEHTHDDVVTIASAAPPRPVPLSLAGGGGGGGGVPPNAATTTHPADNPEIVVINPYSMDTPHSPPPCHHNVAVTKQSAGGVVWVNPENESGVHAIHQPSFFRQGSANERIQQLKTRPVPTPQVGSAPARTPRRGGGGVDITEDPVASLRRERETVLREMHKREVEGAEQNAAQLAGRPSPRPLSERSKAVGTTASPCCVHCNGRVPANASFCIHCGRRLTTPLGRDACISCNHHLNANSHFCTNCGRPVGVDDKVGGGGGGDGGHIEVASPTQYIHNAEGSMYCTRCTRSVAQDYFGNCALCGTKGVTRAEISQRRSVKGGSSLGRYDYIDPIAP